MRRSIALLAPLVRLVLPLWLVLSEHVSELRRRIEEAGVRSSFFVCSTPRTGSTMLGELLAGSGLVGRPGEEFGEVFRTEVLPGLDRAGFDAYLLDRMGNARGTGVFGVKLQWHQLELFLHHLRLRRGVRGMTDRELLEAIFPEPRFIWLRREDILAQAVSWWKAMTTGAWTDGRPPTGEPRFDFGGIDGRLRRAQEQSDAWKRWFAANGIEPLPIRYEELVADPAGVTRRTLAFLGVEVPEEFAVEPRTARQADLLNEEWIGRYRVAAALDREPESHGARIVSRLREDAPRIRRTAAPSLVAYRLVALVGFAAVLVALLFAAIVEALGDRPVDVI